MKRQAMICLFYYGGNMFWVQMFLAFIAGIIVCKLMRGLLTFGYSAIILKQVHDDSLKIMGIISQDLTEIHHLKFLELQKAGKSNKEIEIAQNVSDYHRKSIQDTIIRNFISTFPKSYSSILQFCDWESAMQHLDELIKEERQNKFKK